MAAQDCDGCLMTGFFGQPTQFRFHSLDLPQQVRQLIQVAVQGKTQGVIELERTQGGKGFVTLGGQAHRFGQTMLQQETLDLLANPATFTHQLVT